MPQSSAGSTAGIAAGLSLLGTGINAASSAASSASGRSWTEAMYRVQRQDALTDQAFQNEYNSPAAQMKRLREAGLNPHLVYGDGATTLASNIRGSNPQSWKPEVPQVDVSGASNAIMKYTELKNTEQQTDNLLAQRRLLEQQAIGEAARTQATGAQTDRSKFDLEQLRINASTQIEQLKANLRSTEANTTFTLDENARKAAMQAPNLATALQNVLNLRAQEKQTGAQTEYTRQQTEHTKQLIENLKNSNQLQKFDIMLRERGINPGDPGYMRAVDKLLSVLPTNEDMAPFEEVLRGIIKNFFNLPFHK